MVKNSKQSPAITFPGQGAGESFEFYFRQHWMRLVRPMRLLIVGSLVYAGLLWLLAGMPDDGTRQTLLVGVSSGFILLNLVLLARFYTYFLYVVVVTDQKVHRIKKTLVAVDDRLSIDLWSLNDITKHQRGIIQNMFGFGTVVLHGTEQLKIHFVPNIRAQIDRLSILRAQARARGPAGAPIRTSHEEESWV